MSGRIEGKVAVITGGASGIGLGIARRFVAEGAAVVLGDINEEALKSAADALGGAASTRLADVTREDDLAALCADAVELHGRLDIGVLYVARRDVGQPESVAVIGGHRPWRSTSAV